MQLKWLKATLRRIPADTIVPIFFGPLRGKKWIRGASLSAYWLGLFEVRKSTLFVRTLHPGDVVFDLGANVGYYTMIASLYAGGTGCVVAFEPLPQNISYLKRHLELNQMQNVRLVDVAVADVSETSSFDAGNNRSMGKLAAEGEIKVTTVCLDDLLARQEFPVPQVLKIDIEGAELRALRGAQNLLTKRRPKLFIATHSDALHQGCRKFLAELGYNVRVLEWKAADQIGELYAE